MVRTTQPSAARTVVKAMRGRGSPARATPPLAGLAWGDQLTGAPSLSGTHRGSSLRCIGTFITNARYWIGPVSGDPPSSPVSSIRSTKPCFPRSGAFRWNHHGHFRFAYRVLRLAPLWIAPASFNPRRSAATMGANAADDPLLRYPITGTAACCARATNRATCANNSESHVASFTSVLRQAICRPIGTYSLRPWTASPLASS